MQIKWTNLASEDLEAIQDYIHAENPVVAKEFISDLLQKIERLKEFPLLGSPGVIPLTRKLVIHKNYVVHYMKEDDAIFIVRLLHARRKFP
jgi:toxin ParE1/3/4